MQKNQRTPRPMSDFRVLVMAGSSLQAEVYVSRLPPGTHKVARYVFCPDHLQGVTDQTKVVLVFAPGHMDNPLYGHDALREWREKGFNVMGGEQFRQGIWRKCRGMAPPPGSGRRIALS